MVAINPSATRPCARAESCLKRSCLAKDFWAIERKICRQIADHFLNVTTYCFIIQAQF